MVYHCYKLCVCSLTFLHLINMGKLCNLFIFFLPNRSEIMGILLQRYILNRSWETKSNCYNDGNIPHIRPQSFKWIWKTNAKKQKHTAEIPTTFYLMGFNHVYLLLVQNFPGVNCKSIFALVYPEGETVLWTEFNSCRINTCRKIW